MYHRGGDGDWHHGHYQNPRNGPPPRNPSSRPYRGGYRDQREHNNYSQYNDYNQCQDRSYTENQFVNNQEHPYHDDNRQYHGYREPRGQGYYRGGRHENSYQKDFRGSYQQNHAHKKFPFKSPKSYRKDDDARERSATQKPEQSVTYNTSRNIITLTDGSFENTSSNETCPSQDAENHPQEGSKRDIAMHDEHNQRRISVTVQFTEGGAEPSEEDTELSDEHQEHSKEGTGILDEERNPINDCVKIKPEDEKLDEHSIEPISSFTQNTTEVSTQPSCITEVKTDSTQDVHQTQPIIKEEVIPVLITGGKRAHSEDSDFCITEDDTEEESFFSKRMRTWQEDKEQIHMSKPVEIPLLDNWGDDSADTSGTSTQHPEPTVDLKQPETAKELRKAFILAKKEEIESAFSQDCRTFAFVADTLLKKEPSMEATVTNALRSALQDIAGRCVQELRHFVEQYDSVVLNASTPNRALKSDK